MTVEKRVESMIIMPLTLKDCAQAAQLHQAAFYRGWTEKDFQDFLNDPLVFGMKIGPLSKLPTAPKTVMLNLFQHLKEIPKQVRDDSEAVGNAEFQKQSIQESENFCGYILWREVEDEAEILTLVVDPPYQRKGFGNLLLASLINHLKEKGISKLFLEVAEDNEKAKSFYIKNGFTLMGKRPNYYERPGPRFVDGLNFYKSIKV